MWTQVIFFFKLISQLWDFHSSHFHFLSFCAALGMPLGAPICPLISLFVSEMTLTKPVWSRPLPCWCICYPNDSPAEVIARMSSPFSPLIHVEMPDPLWLPAIIAKVSCRLKRTLWLAHSLSLKHHLRSQLEQVRPAPLSILFIFPGLFAAWNLSMEIAQYC